MRERHLTGSLFRQILALAPIHPGEGLYDSDALRVGMTLRSPLLSALAMP